jgi:hypothetical protein
MDLAALEFRQNGALEVAEAARLSRGLGALKSYARVILLSYGRVIEEQCVVHQVATGLAECCEYQQ